MPDKTKHKKLILRPLKRGEPAITVDEGKALQKMIDMYREKLGLPPKKSPPSQES